ncbi:threonine transporter RhtB [Actinorhabdospora filicis]|uniref:Threonine transporter RhtB n=1 Tax=Actinorhabdospora filicis TaxID=1785913 RepID=A0A9W6W2L8_9ACTN|nr:LysE family translocator [Actinorhabdospora filicis]GLZ77152.1 threonine transporter RhtB [Actinorhabdospora filicis]
MISTPHLLAFIGIIAVGTISPGPDFAMVVRQAAVSGRVAGSATSLGISVGIFGWMVATATGLAALLAASAIAYAVVKGVGALYLLYLGVKALREAARRGEKTVDAPVAAAPRLPVWRAFRQGLLCNVLNPKAAAIYLALVPQFLGDDPGPGLVVLLGAIASGITLVWYVGVSNLVGAFRTFLRRPKVRRVIDAVTGSVLVALGIRVAATARSV